MKPSAATFTLEELSVGQSASFNAVISETEIDRFAALSGDENPLHTEPTFARQRGYADRVAHGAYLVALASRLAGMYLPGQNSLLLAVNMSFSAPVLIGTRVTVSAVIDQLSHSVRSVVLKLLIADAATRETLARGKLTVGFTRISDQASLGYPSHG